MFINLTPHEVTYIHADGTTETFPYRGVARASQVTEFVGTVDGYRVTRSTFGAPVDLPEPQDGVYLIVSLATAQAAIRHGRTAEDLYTVNETVRDSAGRIAGCKSFARVD